MRLDPDGVALEASQHVIDLDAESSQCPPPAWRRSRAVRTGALTACSVLVDAVALADQRGANS